MLSGNSSKIKGIAIDGVIVRRIMPHGYPFQMFDRVQEFDHERGYVAAIKNVAQNDPFIQGHFPGNPIFPGVLLIEALAQTAGCGWIVSHMFDQGLTPEELQNVTEPHHDSMATILVESKIKHTNPVFPGDQVLLESTTTFKRDDLCQCKVVASVNGNEVTKGTVTMARVPHSYRRSTAV
jgi:3-hydroxyacyl-[acyl-carrier-protein] dehydratase